MYLVLSPSHERESFLGIGASAFVNVIWVFFSSSTADNRVIFVARDVKPLRCFSLLIESRIHAKCRRWISHMVVVDFGWDQVCFCVSFSSSAQLHASLHQESDLQLEAVCVDLFFRIEWPPFILYPMSKFLPFQQLVSTEIDYMTQIARLEPTRATTRLVTSPSNERKSYSTPMLFTGRQSDCSSRGWCPRWQSNHVCIWYHSINNRYIMIKQVLDNVECEP